MKIKYLLFISLIWFAPLSGSAQKTEAETEFALEFNDFCASMTDSLYEYGIEWGEKFQSVVGNGNYASLAPLSKKLISSIERYQKELIKRKTHEDMDDLKVAMLDFLTFEKNMILTAFIPFEQFNSGTSEETIDAQIKTLMAASEQEGAVLSKVNMEQQKLADLYDFNLEVAE